MPRDNDPLVYRGPTWYSFGPKKDEEEEERLAAEAALAKEEEERRAAEAALASIAAGVKQGEDAPSRTSEPKRLSQQSLFERVSNVYRKQAERGNVFSPEEIEKEKLDKADEETRALNAPLSDEEARALNAPLSDEKARALNAPLEDKIAFYSEPKKPVKGFDHHSHNPETWYLEPDLVPGKIEYLKEVEELHESPVYKRASDSEKMRMEHAIWESKVDAVRRKREEKEKREKKFATIKKVIRYITGAPNPKEKEYAEMQKKREQQVIEHHSQELEERKRKFINTERYYNENAKKQKLTESQQGQLNWAREEIERINKIQEQGETAILKDALTTESSPYTPSYQRKLLSIIKPPPFFPRSTTKNDR